jgi:hypothetical protein
MDAPGGIPGSNTDRAMRRGDRWLRFAVHRREDALPCQSPRMHRQGGKRRGADPTAFVQTIVLRRRPRAQQFRFSVRTPVSGRRGNRPWRLVASRPPDLTAAPPADETAPSRRIAASRGRGRGSNLDDHASTSLHRAPWMAGVAQLVERQVVVLDAVGSSPIARPIHPA